MLIHSRCLKKLQCLVLSLKGVTIMLHYVSKKIYIFTFNAYYIYARGMLSVIRHCASSDSPEMKTLARMRRRIELAKPILEWHVCTMK